MILQRSHSFSLFFWKELVFWSLLHSIYIMTRKSSIAPVGLDTCPVWFLLYGQLWLFDLKEIHWLPFCSTVSLYSSIQNCLHLVICALLAVLMAYSHMFLEPAWHPTLCGDGWQPLLLFPSLPSLSNSLHTQAIASASRLSPPPQQCTSPAFSLHQLPSCSHFSAGAVWEE